MRIRSVGGKSRALAWSIAGLLVPCVACTPPEKASTDGALEAAKKQETTAATPLDGPEATVTILTTNAADVVGGATGPTQGEWSFSAWVEVGDRAFLFDTGWSPRNVLENAEALGIDLSRAEDLILSHNHGDHTGGVLTLRTEMAKRDPKALSRIHVAPGIFASRPTPDGGERNPLVAMREKIEATGAEFLVHDGPTEIAPGVWVTGPVARHHEEKNYPSGPNMVIAQEDGQLAPDTIPESQSLVVLAKGGPILISGCGHAGLINTLEQTRTDISDDPVQSAIGGFHLFGADDETLAWTSEQVAALELGSLLGSHCTGFEALYRIRELAGMTRESARVGAIGTKFVAGSGIVAGSINR